MSAEELYEKYKKSKNDIEVNQVDIAKKCLKWRLNSKQPSCGNMSWRTDVIVEYMPYLKHDERAIRKVKERLSSRWKETLQYAAAFDQYRNHPSFVHLFKTNESNATMSEALGIPLPSLDTTPNHAMIDSMVNDQINVITVNGVTIKVEGSFTITNNPN